MRPLRSFLFLLLLPTGLLAQQGTDAYQQARAVPEPYQGGWRADVQQEAADMWKVVAEQAPEDAGAQWNYFRTERNACLARNNGYIPATDQKRLGSIAEDLEANAPNTFETHLANYYVDFPDRAAFTELTQATALSPQRIELIGPQLNRANLDGDDAGLTQWSKAMSERGDLSPALLDVAGDLLMSIDANAIVFTGGDMDTWPVLVKQRVRNERKDVLVIDQRLLADPAYRRRCWGLAQAAGQAPGGGIDFVKALVDATTRPVYLALSLGPEWSQALRNDLYASGIALRYTHSGVDNVEMLAKRWSAMKKTTAAGPLSINYLLPGAVLLRHYREVGDEQHAASLEAELRKLGDALHATDKLYKLGVLQH